MSNILFLTSVYDHDDKGNLNVDLIDVFANHGHLVTVMTPKERKYNPTEKIESYGNITYLQFKCLNFRGKVNVIEKGISTLSLGFQYRKAWKKYFSNEKYDLIVYTTMPITYSPILRYVKKKCGAYCYLQQKDFFPQSAVDLELLKKHSLPYYLFRRIEIQLFNDSDKIGVISPKNLDYIKKDNPWIPDDKVEVCPNGITPTTDDNLIEISSRASDIRRKYSIKEDSVVYLYGGNISRSQGIPFIKEFLTEFNHNPISNAVIMIVGNGNCYEDLEKHVVSLNNKSIRILPYLPKKEFDQILSIADVGLVFLDKRFTIANIPSRTLAHMDFGQPILAATDLYTDYRELIEDNGIGLWCPNGDVNGMMQNMRKMTEDKSFRLKCGNNSRKYLLNKSTAEIAYNTIINSYFSHTHNND